VYYRINYACGKGLKFTYTQEGVYVLLHLLQFHRYVYGVNLHLWHAFVALYELIKLNKDKN